MIPALASLTLGALMLGDFLMGLPVRRATLVLLSLPPAGVLLLGLFHRGRRRVVQLMGLAVLALAAGLYLAEGLFRTVLVENGVPVTTEEFERRILSSWPRRIPERREEGTFRILGLCDSFGVVGGPRNYHYLLEELLRGEGWQAEVVNFSIPASQPLHEARLLSRFGARYQPDLILHGFFVGNDFEPSHGDRLFYRNVPIEQTPFSLRPRHLLIGQWLGRYLEVQRDHRVRRQEAGWGKVPAAHSEERFLQIERRRMDLCLPGAILPSHWAEVSRHLDGIRREAARMGARYLLVLHPDSYQVDFRVTARVRDRYGLDLSRYEMDLPQALLRRFCAERGIPCLDLLPLFRARTARSDLYGFRDTHYSDAGNALAGEAIRDFLSRKAGEG